MGRPRIYCKCGCREKVKPGNNYIHGHAWRGKAHTEYTKKKLSEIRKGKSIGENNPNYGNKMCVESRNRISIANKKHWGDSEKRKTLGLKIKNIWAEQGHPRKGIRHTDSAKKKMSIAKQGVYCGEGHPQYGSKKSFETRQKISKRKIGIPLNLSDDQRKNRSIKTRGANNPNWRGGTSLDPYCFEFTNDLKGFIKERDNHTCQNPDCTRKFKKLSIHHIDYNKKHCEPKDLITICNSCNSRANGNREYWRDLYRSILKKEFGYAYD